MSAIPCNKEMMEVYRKEKYLNNTWTQEEQILKNRPNIRNQFLAEHIASFNKCINEVVRKSFFGIFLKYFNPQHDQNPQFNEDKLAIFNYQLNELEVPKRKLAESKNRFTEGFQDMFLDAIKYEDVIDWDYLYEKIQTLRLLSHEINTLDKRMKTFRNLQVLVLSGNWITDLDGKNLPRKLVFLELYANQIKKLDNLLDDPPKNLKYLGLGRNCLNDHSGYHLLDQSKSLQHLKCIDLSNNDICKLGAIVARLSHIQGLVSLSLEGNPCWVLPLYKNILIHGLHLLRILDNTELLGEDKLFNNYDIFNVVIDNPALVFTCFRIISLPPPPKQKGAQNYFHIEVSLPLLEEIVIPPEVKEGESVVSATKPKKAKSKTKGRKKSKSSKGKKGKLPDVYAGENECDTAQKSKVKNTNFKTDRKTWDKIIEFPEVAIESPENDMRAIRDCFRSRVNVKVIYQLVEPPQKPKKGKKGKKDKKGKKKEKKKGKGKKSKDGASDKKTSKSTSKAAVEEKVPEETILKRITIANFFCDLHYVNWSDDSVDFYWANHPKANPVAIPVDGTLKYLKYQAKGGGKGKGKAKTKEPKKKKTKEKNTDPKEESPKPTDEASTGEIKITKIEDIQPIGFPPMFTAHVGFGLKRS